MAPGGGESLRHHRRMPGRGRHVPRSPGRGWLKGGRPRGGALARRGGTARGRRTRGGDPAAYLGRLIPRDWGLWPWPVAARCGGCLRRSGGVVRLGRPAKGGGHAGGGGAGGTGGGPAARGCAGG